MVIPVPPRDSFDIEPGRYRATCTEIREIEKQTRKGTQKNLRIVWELDIPTSENIRYLAGKNYEPTLAKDSTLRHDLRTWFGHDINARQFDTATLKGKEAILTVQDIENEGSGDDWEWATATIHVKTLAEAESTLRPVLCDVVLNTPDYRLGIGDADGEVIVPCPGTGRTRLVVSADDVGEGGLDEVWVDLMPC